MPDFDRRCGKILTRAFSFFTETLQFLVLTQFRTENRYALFLELLWRRASIWTGKGRSNTLNLRVVLSEIDCDFRADARGAGKNKNRRRGRRRRFEDREVVSVGSASGARGDPRPQRPIGGRAVLAGGTGYPAVVTAFQRHQ
nr:hypothetical protein [Mesorhizobium loti]